MSKGLETLEELKNYFDNKIPLSCNGGKRRLEIIEQELKECEKKDNVLKTISDIIRDFNNGEFASAEIALQEITTILREVLL